MKVRTHLIFQCRIERIFGRDGKVVIMVSSPYAAYYNCLRGVSVYTVECLAMCL